MMKRLTTRYEDGVQIGTARFKYGCTIAPARAAFGLADYEDTGLTPAEIIKLNTFAGSQLEKLLAENKRLREQLERAKADMYEAGPCFLCQNFKDDDEWECANPDGCQYGDTDNCREPLGFKWRGEENTQKYHTLTAEEMPHIRADLSVPPPVNKNLREGESNTPNED